MDGLPRLQRHGQSAGATRRDPVQVGLLTLVLRVRLTTLPALMMRSNSKQPFWLTGDMMPMLALAALRLSNRGCASVSSFMPAERTGVGVAGMPSAMGSRQLLWVTSNRGGGGGDSGGGGGGSSGDGGGGGSSGSSGDQGRNVWWFVGQMLLM
jgi:uncharacterized membrane protein YgcG